MAFLPEANKEDAFAVLRHEALGVNHLTRLRAVPERRSPTRLVGTLMHAGPEDGAPVISPSRVHPLAQSGRGEAKGFGELGDVFDAGIAQAALDVADVGGIEAGFLGELFLREFAGLAILPDVQPEGGKDFVTFRHDS